MCEIASKRPVAAAAKRKHARRHRHHVRRHKRRRADDQAPDASVPAPADAPATAPAIPDPLHIVPKLPDVPLPLPPLHKNGDGTDKLLDFLMGK